MNASAAAAVLFLAASLTGACAREGEGGWKLEPGQHLSVQGKLTKGKDVSGAACFSPTKAVVGSDETRSLQSVAVDTAAGTLLARGVVPLLTVEGTEIDIEGVAASTSARAYFITGSHSLSRLKMKFEEDRNSVFRLPVTAEGDPLPAEVKKASLRPLLMADPQWRVHVDAAAEDGGVDIEGLAEREGVLFFGLRSPVIDGQATVLEVKADDLFAGGGSMKKHALALGPGRGIRDIVAVTGGFLVLSGGCGADRVPKSAEDYQFHFWSGGEGAAPVFIGTLGKTEGKAEGLLVVRDEGKGLDVVVFFDGIKNGGPQLCRIARP